MIYNSYSNYMKDYDIDMYYDILTSDLHRNHILCNTFLLQASHLRFILSYIKCSFYP
jgi:hypothetical protein